MRKSDLRSGMAVEIRGGLRLILVDMAGELIMTWKDCYGEVEKYNDDLSSSSLRANDIMRVWPVGASYTIDHLENLKPEDAIWSRGEPKEITAEEAFRKLKEIYGCEVKIINEP